MSGVYTVGSVVTHARSNSNSTGEQRIACGQWNDTSSVLLVMDLGVLIRTLESVTQGTFLLR